jgi:hypothetical protein
MSELGIKLNVKQPSDWGKVTVSMANSKVFYNYIYMTILGCSYSTFFLL